MDNAAKNQKLKHLFKTHPQVNRFYFTSDGQAFIRADHAEAHGKSLDDKEVSPVSRSVFEQIEKKKEELTSKSGDKAKSSKTSKKEVSKKASDDAKGKTPENTGNAGAGEGSEKEADNQTNA